MRILVVEDEISIRNGLKNLIKKLEPNSEILVAENGLEGISICDKINIDLVFTDIKMPNMNGLEMIKVLKSKVKSIVIVSGYADFTYAQQAIEDGVFEYILKPIKPLKIKEVLEKVKIENSKKKEEDLKDYILNYEVLDENNREYLLDRLGIEKYYFIIEEKDNELEKSIINNEDNKNINIKNNICIAKSKIRNNVISIVSSQNKEELLSYRESIKCYAEKVMISEVNTDKKKLHKEYVDLKLNNKNNKNDSHNDSNIIKTIKNYIHQNYECNITLNDIAKVAYVHPTYISKVFKKETEQNLTDYILGYRISVAKRLLQDNRYKIYEVAEKSGFKDSKYFGNVFKSEVGVTPSEYRNKM